MESKTDCRTETGITVSMIDAIITLCRVLKDRDLSNPAIVEALKDLHDDEDLKQLINGII